MGILDRIAQIVKAEMNYRIKKSIGDSNLLDEELESEIRHLEEELKQQAYAEQNSKQSGTDRNHSSNKRYKDTYRKKTYYDILEVSIYATQKELKTSYRRLAKKYHPDRVQKLDEKLQNIAKKKMKEINEAYDYLGTPQKRRLYDLKEGLH